MLGHNRGLNKFKKVEIISSIFFWPQWYETRNQLLKEKWEKNKHVETKYPAAKVTMGELRNQRGNQKITREKWK